MYSTPAINDSFVFVCFTSVSIYPVLAFFSLYPKYFIFNVHNCMHGVTWSMDHNWFYLNYQFYNCYSFAYFFFVIIRSFIVVVGTIITSICAQPACLFSTLFFALFDSHQFFLAYFFHTNINDTIIFFPFFCHSKYEMCACGVFFICLYFIAIKYSKNNNKNNKWYISV